MSPVKSEQLSFRVSPRVLAPLGMEQLQDPALAVLELVKNSWDANATRVLIEVRKQGSTPEISVTDNGSGMDLDDFRDRWLVIGSSHKRGAMAGNHSRPLIGEKGLGRLASYALGNTLQIESANGMGKGFRASLNWDALLQSSSVEDYKINVVRASGAKKGTRVVIKGLKAGWTEENTNFLTTHAQFLTSVPGERFAILIKIDKKSFRVKDPLEAISKISEAEMVVEVQQSGIPKITHSTVSGDDLTGLAFRDFSPRLVDRRLSGSKLVLKFYRRDKAARKLSGILNSNEVSDVLERYQGIRIYRDGINVPPYGLHGDDWAALEKQRTSTGGPTMVPGNSQLTGELRVPASAKHLVITAGRSGFSDQSAVKGMAAYVQWAVRELGTARRAHALGIRPGEGAVPGRVDTAQKSSNSEEGSAARAVLRDVADEHAVKKDPELRSKVNVARKVIERELDRNEETLRLYAQLASTGIAATSFAHELRADFDVVSEAVFELSEEDESDSELIALLSDSWKRITNFVALFRLLPVKVRRQRRLMSPSSVQQSLDVVSKLAPADKVAVTLVHSNRKLSLVPAELDSILLNLVSNAVKAIAESTRSSAGKIRIALVDHGFDLEISVSDNGSGIPNTVASVMFEPLEGKFSEGTGMGLPIVRFIAERYDGRVDLSRSPPKGYSTEFRVRLRGVVK